MIRMLFTLTIGAAIGLAFAREQRKVEHLREELLELEIAFDELQYERKAMQESNDFPEYLEEK